MALAKALKFCLICKDDVREAALRHDAVVQADLRAAVGESVASTLRVDSNDMTYEAMFAVGLTQLKVGMPGVVLESPLGRVTLGHRALAITREADALCVLVDCYAERCIWEERLAARKEKQQFKPTDADKIVRSYTNIEYEMDCDAHVRVDCALPPDHNVQIVERIIKQLLAEG